MNRLKLALVAGVAMVAPLAAQASVQGSIGTNGLPMLALTSAGLTGAATLTGGTVYPANYSQGGTSVVPAGTPSNNNYLSAGPGPSAPLPNATLTFTSPVNYVSFLWGSPDTYNSLSVTSTTGTYTFTAAGLGLGSLSGDAGFSQYVQFLATSSGERILSATFSSSTNAFEVSGFKAAAVPGPIAGAGIPALMALGGALFMRRRKQA